MDFTALKQELADRGFSYLSDARQGQFINWARAELDSMFLWPYRATNTTSASNTSVAISDLGTIKYVLYQLTPSVALEVVDKDWLQETYGDLSTTGTPQYAFEIEGTPRRVGLYPVGPADVDFLVLYYKDPADLSAGSDEPLAPARFHDIIVDLAVERAYRDSDNHAAAEQLRVAIERRLATMVKDLLMDGTTPKIRTGRGHW